MPTRSPSRCRPGATTSPRRWRWIRRRTSIPAVAAKAAEGCAAIEPECDLIEEVLRLRGLDAVPPVSLPRTAPVPLPTLTPRQQRARAGAAHAGGARAWPSASPSASWRRARRGAVRRHPEALRLTNPIAADLDQLRPTPVATLALAAQRNAARGFGRRGAVRGRTGLREPDAARPAPGRRRAARRRHAAQLARAGARRWMRWTPRPICGRRWRRSACRWTR